MNESAAEELAEGELAAEMIAGERLSSEHVRQFAAYTGRIRPDSGGVAASNSPPAAG